MTVLDPNRPVPGWTARPRPDHRVFTGRHVRLEPLSLAHAAGLHAANSEDASGEIWTWLAYGPFADLASYEAWVAASAASSDPLFFAVFDLDRDPARPVGVMSLLRIDPANGVAEVGHICFSPALQRTRATTEAQALLMRHVFDELGYRRYEWKCNAANEPSRTAARRLGFIYEGTFPNHMIVKGRNRDTAWFGMIAEDWPGIRAGFDAWLDPSNFDSSGHQIRKLESRP